MPITCINPPVFFSNLVICFFLPEYCSWKQTPWLVEVLGCLLFYTISTRINYYNNSHFSPEIVYMYRYFWNIYSANILPWSLHHLSQVCSTKQLFLQNSEKYINMAKYHLGKVRPSWVFLSTVCVTCGVHVVLRGFAGLLCFTELHVQFS